MREAADTAQHQVIRRPARHIARVDTCLDVNRAAIHYEGGDMAGQLAGLSGPMVQVAAWAVLIRSTVPAEVAASRIRRKKGRARPPAPDFRSMNMLLRPIALGTLLSAMVPLRSHGQAPALVGYWHNWNDLVAPYIQLDQVDPRYNVIEVSFSVPAIGTSHQMEFTPSETTPSALAGHVAALQAQGRKVLISIGGANAAIHLDSDAERDEFVSSMLAIIGTYGFDGMDIDLEGSSVAITGGSITAPTDATILRLIGAVNTIADTFSSQSGSQMMLPMAREREEVEGC